MKKYTLALAFAALLPFASASAYEYGQAKNGYNASRQVGTSSYKNPGSTRKSGGYRNVITNNFYYNQPSQSNYYAPRKSSYNGNDYYTPNGYRGNDYYAPTDKSQSKNISKSYSSQERKFFLAHPFFQPLRGNFGSVTDVSYASNNFKFDILNGSIYDVDPVSPNYNTNTPFLIVPGTDIPLSGKAETTQIAVKEDFSYGISDTLALIGMIQYDKTEVNFKEWSDGTGSNSKSDSGLNIFGVGVQNRFLDNDKWIGMVAGFFQHQRKTANTFIGDLKIGYKIDRTTVYGLGRVGYSDLIEGDIYGMYTDDEKGNYLMLAYKSDVKDVTYVEGGIGAFAVLSKDFTLNGEVLYGYYDWHNQLSVKGGLGWQPGSSFALNLYASMSVKDSAKNKTKTYMNYEKDPDPADFPPAYQSIIEDTTAIYTMGDYKIKDYNEWKIGVQGILYF